MKNYLDLEVAAKRSEKELFQELQKMMLDDVAHLLIDPLGHYPALRAALPIMPPADVQRAWTGTSGEALLHQSISFVRAMTDFYTKDLGENFQGSKILDYGCGWGRLLRLMYKFTSPDNLYGCDAWANSLQLCFDSHVRANLEKCEEIPKSVPFPEVKFDIIYAFSVFTHLSEKTSLSVITALRNAISEQGLLAVTVRPIEYWDAHDQNQSKVDVVKMIADHKQMGYAFTPHNRPPIDGEVTYGDTSISSEYIYDHWNGWQIVGEPLYAADPFQKIVFLRPLP